MKAFAIECVLALHVSVQEVKTEQVAPSPRACQLQMGCRTRRRENRCLAKEDSAAVAKFLIERPFLPSNFLRRRDADASMRKRLFIPPWRAVGLVTQMSKKKKFPTHLDSQASP